MAAVLDDTLVAALGVTGSQKNQLTHRQIPDSNNYELISVVLNA